MCFAPACADLRTSERALPLTPAVQFVNFGLGPVISRTPDLLPLAGNIVAFCVAAAAVGYSPKISQAVGLTTDEDGA